MITNRRTVLLATTALAATALAPRPARALDLDPDALARRADEALNEAVQSGAVAGVAAMVVDRERTLYEGAFGERVLGEGEPMTLDTVMLIASMTKVVTAIAVMQLVERGEIDLDTSAETYVPSIGGLRVLEGWDGDAPIRREPATPLTMRHLLTQTAGMAYGLWSADQGRSNEARAIPSVLTGDPKALQGDLMTDPGERWEYGTSMDWAAEIVEAVSGQTLGAYMDEHIFQPLGMADTAYFISPEMRERLAKVHQREDGRLAPIDLEREQNPPVEMGGGGLYTTATDFAKVVRMMLNGGELDGARLLEPETVTLMSRNAIGDLRLEPYGTQAPSFAADLDMHPGIEKSWSLGLMVLEEDAPTGLPAGSVGWTGIANTFFWIDPQNGIGGVWFSQTLPFLDEPVRAAYEAFQSAIYAP